MERLSQHSNKTELVDRTLWYDGDSTVASDRIVELISTGVPVEGLFVETLTADIERYNQLVGGDEKITIKKSNRPLGFDWNIPEEYKSLDVREYVRGSNPGSLDRKRMDRIEHELDLYETFGLIDVLRVLIYVINTLQAQNVVWGVGRGSSVSSYVLYLIGVHDVDSVEYDLDITDFLRVEEPSGEK